MKKSIILGTVLLLIGSNSAHAANFAVITNPPTVLNILILVIALTCMVSSVKVLDLVKGGMLSKSWQFFMGAFLALAISQLALLLHQLEIVEMPPYVVPALLVLMAGLFSYGVLEIRRTLS